MYRNNTVIWGLAASIVLASTGGVRYGGTIVLMIMLVWHNEVFKALFTLLHLFFILASSLFVNVAHLIRFYSKSITLTRTGVKNVTKNDRLTGLMELHVFWGKQT